MPDGLPDVPAEMVDSIGDAIEGITPEVTPEASNPQEPTTPATPEGQATEEAATDAPDSFTKLDPNAIPPEVKPYYDSMLADYTRKTQEAAGWRNLGKDLGIDSPDQVREAAELYAYLQDPNNMRELYDSLGQYLGQPVEPAAATRPDPVQGVDDAFAALDDPAVSDIRRELADLRQQMSQQEETRQQEALQWQLIGEMNRQEAALKEQHPEWGQEDWDALWAASVSTNGDLHAAAAQIEAAQNAAITRLLNAKATAASTPGLVPEAPVRLGSTVSEPDYSDLELRDQTAQAIEYVRGVVNQSE